MTKFFKQQLLTIAALLLLFQFSNAQSLTYYRPDPFSLNTEVSYGGIPFSVAGTETSPEEMTFSNDGLRVYIIGPANDRVYQYNLTTPFEVTSGVSYFVSFSVASQETFPQGVHFSPDGTKMFVLGREDGGEINQYTLSNTSNVSTATFDGSPFTVGTAFKASGFTFSNDGMKMYVTFITGGGTSGHVKEYALTNPFDITSGVSQTSSRVVSSFPTDVAFSSDGSKMFILDIGTDDVNEYSLSTPFDITSASTGTDFSVVNEDDEPTGLAFSSDGNKMFVVGRENDGIYQYSLGLAIDGDMEEVEANDGSLAGTLQVDISGDTFTNAGGTLTSPSDYSITNLPSGLNSTMSVAADGLSAILTFSGNATNHQETNDLDAFEFTFEDGAFTSNDASSVGNAQSYISDFGIAFDDNTAQLIYDDLNTEDDFIETVANTGSVESENMDAVIGLTGDTFTNAGGTLSQANYAIANLPAGLTPMLSVAGDGLSVTLSLTGSVSSHQASNSVANLIFTFEDGAFTGGDANLVANTTSASSGFDITFNDNPVITYGFDAFDFDAGPTFDGNSSLSGISSASDIAFNDDGTRMFVANTGTLLIQYDLEVPYDITSTFSSVGSDGKNSSQRGFVFNNDGSKMFELLTFTGSGSLNQPRVREYTLSIPYDITSTITFQNTFNIIAQENSPGSITFNDDGSKMYIVGGNGLNQYTLSTPFSLASVSHDGNESISGTPTDITFSSDGATMFILGTQFDNVARYNLTTPFDITSGFTSAGDAFSVSAQNTSPNGLAFSPDGSKMYMVGSGSFVNQYSIEAGGFSETVANAGAVEGSLTVRLTGDTFTNAGGSLSGSDYTINNLPASLTSNLDVAADGLSAELTLSGSADDHQTTDDVASLNFTFANSAFTTNNAGGVFNAINAESDFGIDFDDNARLVYGFDAFDLEAGVTYDGSSISVLSEEGNVNDVAFSTDGNKMFIIGNTGDEVNQYSLTTPFDVTSGVSFDGSPLSISSEASASTSFAFSPDGTKMFVLGLSGDEVNQYSLSNPFDVTSGVSFDGSPFSISSEETSPTGLAFSTDGTKMFVLGLSGDDVNQYTLSNPFDVTSGASFSGISFSVASEEASPHELEFSTDGMKMFVIGISGDDVNQYELNMPFDLSTGATFKTNFSVQSEEISPLGLAFSVDGSKMYVLGTTGDDVNQYSINQEMFTEAASDDGSIDGSLTIKIFSDTFTNGGSNLTGSDYSIDNLPSGLTSTLAVAADGQSASLTLGGNAASNYDSDDIASLQFTFENSAFTSTAAADVINGVGFESNAGIDFIGLLAVWNGASWNNGTGPTASDDAEINGNYSIDSDGTFEVNNLTINSSFTLTIDEETSLEIDGDLTNNGSLVVESGSSLITYAANSFTGNNIEIRRNTRYAGGQYSFVGTPVQQNANVTNATVGSYVYYYDETESYENDNGADRWKTMTGQLVPATGYTQANQQAIVFTGVPNTGTITYTGTYTDQGLEANKGWNLVANPYTAAINITDFFTTNTNNSGSVYIWDDNGSDSQRGSNDDYIVANGTMANSNQPGDMDADRYNDHLGSAQAFFVKLDGLGNNNTVFTEGMRRTDQNGDDNFFRETTLPIARINLTDNTGLFKQAVIGLAEDATENELNRIYDGQAFNATSDFGLFTVKAGRSLTLNGMTHDWEVIQLQINTAEAGEYQISLELEAYDQSIYLRDNLTGEITDLRNGAYSFTVQVGINTDRFELIASPTDVLGLETEKVLVYAHNSILHIQQEGDDIREYQLFNMKGQQLLSTSVQSKGEVNLNTYAKGIYLVFDGQKTHKIILD